jgi:hypothetical protein
LTLQIVAHPKPALRSGFDLSPPGRGEKEQTVGWAKPPGANASGGVPTEQAQFSGINVE